MKDKIAYLMKSEGLTTTRFAEILGIQPSAVSHLVSGRNMPRYDLLQKILRRFPRVNPDWLLLDSEDPYRLETSDSYPSSPLSDEPSLFDSVSEPSAEKLPFEGRIKSSSSSSKSPIFVVVFYDDGSCERFSL